MLNSSENVCTVWWDGNQSLLLKNSRRNTQSNDIEYSHTNRVEESTINLSDHLSNDQYPVFPHRVNTNIRRCRHKGDPLTIIRDIASRIAGIQEKW